MLASLVALALGALLFYLGWRQRRLLLASQSWPQAPGRILSARINVSHDAGDEDNAPSTSYSPAVEYEYQVGPDRHVGNRIAFAGRSYNSSKKAQQILDSSFPVGASITVFYDPAKPREAVLERAAPGKNVLLIVGALIFIAGIALLFRH